MRVTLIVPVYNGAKDLPALLDSVLAQTFTDWACLCVDDGSTDDSPTILAKYATTDSRIRVLTQKNSSCGVARNNALKAVETPYVMFADQDDLLHPQAFEIAVRHAVRANVDGLCFAYSKFSSSPKFAPLQADWDITYETKRQGLDLITGRRDSWPIFVWRHIFKTEAVRTTPFPPISGGEDQAWMAELSWRNLSWASIEPALYANRERTNSRSRGLSQGYIRNIFASYDWMRERASLYDVDPKRLNKCIRHMALMFKLSVIYRKLRNF